MQALAPLVAKEKGLTVTDYRDVIRELKKEQLVGDAILPHYQPRLADIESDHRREQLVTLPAAPDAHPPGHRRRERASTGAAHASRRG